MFILYYHFILVDDDKFSSCEFVQLNNNYEELITEINISSNNVEPKYNVITNSNGTENVGTFTSEIGRFIILI